MNWAKLSQTHLILTMAFLLVVQLLDDFFNNLQFSQNNLSEEPEQNSTTGEQTPQETVKFATSDPSVDAIIQRGLVTGNYKVAVNQCISANRIADALVIAHAGGSTLWESTCNNYMRNSTSPYLKVCLQFWSLC